MNINNIASEYHNNITIIARKIMNSKQQDVYENANGVFCVVMVDKESKVSIDSSW